LKRIEACTAGDRTGQPTAVLQCEAIVRRTAQQITDAHEPPGDQRLAAGVGDAAAVEIP